MKIFSKASAIAVSFFALTFNFIGSPIAFAASAPTLGASENFSVLAGSTVTNTGSTTASGSVGVSAGSAITGFPPGIAGGGTHSNDASAIAAQADNLKTFGKLDQPCDQTLGAVDLTATFPAGVGPGVYCSTSSFSLSGNLKLIGSGVWIFKTVSTLITSPGSSVTGGNACSVWWRVGSSATLDTTTSFVGNIFALTDINMRTGATLNGRTLAQTGQVTLQSNVINNVSCSAPTTSTTPSTTSSTTPSATSSPATSSTVGTSPAIKVTKDADKSALHSGPDDVTFTYKVKNVGNVALTDIKLKDDKCHDVKYVSGDKNDDNKLDTNEEWKFRCTKKVSETETNIATAKGTASGVEVKDTADFKVTVSTPSLPNAGVSDDNNLWDIISQQISSIFLSLSI